MQEPPLDSVSADDRGLAYGDGLFETMAVVGGHVRLLDFHLDRLCASAARLRIPADRGDLQRAVVERAQQLGSGVLKLLMTRGSGPRGYAIPLDTTPRCLLLDAARPTGFADQWRDPSAPELNVRLCETPLSVNPALAGMKHLNRLDQVLARSEWTDPAVGEGLMRAEGDAIVCATAANVFALRGRTLITPALSQAGVAGVMRRALLEAARESAFDIVYSDLQPDLLRHRADAVLLSSALTGLRSVGRIDGEALRGGQGRDSDVLKRLRGALGARVDLIT